MGVYVAILCSRCKLPIGHRMHRKYTDEITGLTFTWHSDVIRDCWNELQDELIDEYYWLLYRALRKEVA